MCVGHWGMIYSCENRRPSNSQSVLSTRKPRSRRMVKMVARWAGAWMDAPKRFDFDWGKDLHLSGYDFTDLKYCILLKYVLIWLVVWNIFHFFMYWEWSSQLTNIFRRGWNHQPVMFYGLKNGFSRVPLLSMRVFEMMFSWPRWTCIGSSHMVPVDNSYVQWISMVANHHGLLVFSQMSFGNQDFVLKWHTKSCWFGS